MKIAIQGHLTRGKEVIQILESLGGENIFNFIGKGDITNSYYINDYNEIRINLTPNLENHYKLYTLEEFEKEFPFKVGDKVLWPITIGWWSGIITGINEELSRYEIIDEKCDYHYVAPSKLRLYPMKEERNITLTLDKAKEWYKKGGELREIALQAFNEKELDPLLRSWEEFVESTKFTFNGSLEFINGTGQWSNSCLPNKSIGESSEIWDKHVALFQLEQLRDRWRQGWESDWNNGNQTKYCVCYYQGKFKISVVYETRRFLSFPTYEMAEEFLKCFRDLIEQAGDLI